MNGGMHSPISSDSLADILERVLEKGVVIVGDVTVAIAGIELLTIKVRLLVTTVDKALELGIDWWERDPALTALAAETARTEGLQEQLGGIEARLARIEAMGRTR
ncbi:MAG: gas vesicle protein [Pseudomonadota bacterium]